MLSLLQPIIAINQIIVNKIKSKQQSPINRKSRQINGEAFHLHWVIIACRWPTALLRRVMYSHTTRSRITFTNFAPQISRFLNGFPSIWKTKNHFMVLLRFLPSDFSVRWPLLETLCWYNGARRISGDNVLLMMLIRQWMETSSWSEMYHRVSYRTRYVPNQSK